MQNCWSSLTLVPKRSFRFQAGYFCSTACLTLAAFLSSLLAAHWVYALPLAGRFSISSTAARRALSCHSLSAPCAVLHASSASLSSRTKGESRGDATALPAGLPSLQPVVVSHHVDCTQAANCSRNFLVSSHKVAMAYYTTMPPLVTCMTPKQPLLENITRGANLQNACHGTYRQALLSAC